MIKNKNKYKTLFVEPTEFGHVMLHLSAFFSSDIWKKDSIHFLTPKSVKSRAIEEKILTKNDANKIFVEPLLNGSRFSKLTHLFQLVKLQKKNRYTDICFKYLDYHLLLIPLLKLLFQNVKISGIFFRPVLHYKKLKYPYVGVSKSYWYLMILKNYIVFIYLKTGILTSCFFQDEGAIKIFGGRKKNAFWIPTPLSNDFEIPPPKNNGALMHFLFFGQISKRKGIYRVLEAWQKLPFQYQDKICLSIIGRTTSDDTNSVTKLIGDLVQNGWKINFDNRFVENEEIPGIYAKAHIVLSPHDLQFGTSGVTVQSAVWRRPAIVHNLGWVGFIVKNKKLGLAIDCSNIELFAEIIRKIVDGNILLDVGEETSNELKSIHERSSWGNRIFFGTIGQA